MTPECRAAVEAGGTSAPGASVGTDRPTTSPAVLRNCWSCRHASNEARGCTLAPWSNGVDAWIRKTHIGPACPPAADDCPGWAPLSPSASPPVPPGRTEASADGQGVALGSTVPLGEGEMVLQLPPHIRSGLAALRKELARVTALVESTQRSADRLAADRAAALDLLADTRRARDAALAEVVQLRDALAGIAARALAGASGVRR